MQSPSASPSPILLQVVGSGDGAPWWGVPAVAGFFLLLGGYLTFLLNRANEKRRLMTERDNALTDELMEHAAELIALGHRFSALGQKIIVTSLEQFLPELVEQSTDLIRKHSVLYNRFRLAMPRSIQRAVVAYSAACISLTVPPFDKGTMTVRLESHVRAEQELVNALRRLRGLADLEVSEASGSQARKESFADRASAEMVRTLEENGIDITNAAEEDPGRPRGSSDNERPAQ